MTDAKAKRLSGFLLNLREYGSDDEVELIVALITLLVENFAPRLLNYLHLQNMCRAKYGRDSEQASIASSDLKTVLNAHRVRSLNNAKPIEALKAEFRSCNPSNTWSKTKPVDKAREEIGELAVAIDHGVYNSERLLDALLDIAYAGAEPIAETTNN